MSLAQSSQGASINDLGVCFDRARADTTFRCPVNCSFRQPCTSLSTSTPLKVDRPSSTPNMSLSSSRRHPNLLLQQHVCSSTRRSTRLIRRNQDALPEIMGRPPLRQTLRCGIQTPQQHSIPTPGSPETHARQLLLRIRIRRCAFSTTSIGSFGVLGDGRLLVYHRGVDSETALLCARGLYQGYGCVSCVFW